MSAPQKSIWSLDSSQHQSFTIGSKKNVHHNQVTLNAWSDDLSEDEKDDSKKVGSPLSLCIQCCMIGALVTGIVLAAILAVWLTQPSQTTSQSMSVVSETTISSTSTTLTTTETTTITSVITAAVTSPCPLSSPVSYSVLYTANSVTQTTYKCYAFAWTSFTTGLVTLAFQFNHNIGYWDLDDVSVSNGATQMLSNGNFESGAISPWVRTFPNGPCVLPTVFQVIGASPNTGGFHLRDQCKNRSDKVSQQFMTTSGKMYIVSFWLRSDTIGWNMSVNVTLS